MLFHCRTNNKDSILKFQDGKLTIMNDVQNFIFELSLNQIIIWLFQNDDTIGFQIDDLTVYLESHDLKQLKQQLGGHAMYSGIKYFYQFQETIVLNENGQTKVCTLKKTSNQEMYACKCFKKQGRTLNQIHDEINLLILLQQQGLVPTIYEIYESRNCIYLIMELLQEKMNYEVSEQQMKLIIYNLLQIVQSLETSNIAHKAIKRAHIMFDDENNIKLVGFGSAKIFQVSNYEFRLDITKTIHILEKFYQKYNIKQPNISFLQNQINKQNAYLYDIVKILQDPFFKSIQNDNIFQEIKTMNPKFQKKIEEDDDYQHLKFTKANPIMKDSLVETTKS